MIDKSEYWLENQSEIAGFLKTFGLSKLTTIYPSTFEYREMLHRVRAVIAIKHNGWRVSSNTERFVYGGI